MSRPGHRISRADYAQLKLTPKEATALVGLLQIVLVNEDQWSDQDLPALRRTIVKVAAACRADGA